MTLGSDALDWLENQATRNIEFHEDCRENLENAARSTLSIALVASGALIGYFLNTYDTANSASDHSWTILGPVVATAIYLSALAVFTATVVLRPRDTPAPANEPQNLLPYFEKYSVEQTRHAELMGVQRRIDKSNERNTITAKRLTCVRILLCLAPIVFVAMFAVFAG